jgi:GNAT superfamily N-acetyltransferase
VVLRFSGNFHFYFVDNDTRYKMKTKLRRLTKKEAAKHYDVAELEEFPIFRLSTDHAFVDFDSYQGKLKGCCVLNLETEPAYRNRGHARKLIDDLIKLFGKKNINWGAFTPDGEQFLKPILIKKECELEW